MSDKLAPARHRKLDDGPDAAEDKLSRARHRRLPAAGDASAGAVRAAGAGVAGRGAERLGAHGRPSARKGAFAQGADVEEAAETEAVRFAGAAAEGDVATPPVEVLDENGEPAAGSARMGTVSASAGIMSVCVLLSRITGFARTWAMAFALGSTFLSSSYQVANNLPNMLYELVMAGMLVTAFLPVYISVKKKLGDAAGNEYASNLLTIVTALLGAVSLLGILFPQAIVYTQTFYSDQDTMGTAVFFFQFFAIQTVFYGGSSILSGLLNANRDYFWSTVAPVANNLIVIATFVLFALVSPANPTLALYIIAIGNPLGVAAQMLIQMPALRRNGIRLRPRVNLRDPALRDTVALGAPTIIVMVCSFVTVSVMNAASYCFADDGPSIITYARLWYALPYSLLAIPITTALFTELTHLHEDGDHDGFVRAVTSGTSQIMFLLIPFALYLVVFAFPLVTLYHFGAFTMDNVAQIAAFLAGLAAALPLYGVSSYLQKVFSSLRKMGVFALASVIASVVQVALTMLAVFAFQQGASVPIESIAWASVTFYLVADMAAFVYLKRRFGHVGITSIVRACVLGTLLGGAGALAGFGMLQGLQFVFGALSGSIPQAFLYVVAGGVVSLAVTFGLAVKLRLPEASFIMDIVGKVTRRFGRKRAR